MHTDRRTERRYDSPLGRAKGRAWNGAPLREGDRVGRFPPGTGSSPLLQVVSDDVVM